MGKRADKCQWALRNMGHSDFHMVHSEAIYFNPLAVGHGHGPHLLSNLCRCPGEDVRPPAREEWRKFLISKSEIQWVVVGRNLRLGLLMKQVNSSPRDLQPNPCTTPLDCMLWPPHILTVTPADWILACCCSWGCKGLDTTWRLNNHHHHLQTQNALISKVKDFEY